MIRCFKICSPGDGFSGAVSTAVSVASSPTPSQERGLSSSTSAGDSSVMVLPRCNHTICFAVVNERLS